MTMALLAHYVVGPLGCNCYVVGDPATKDAIVIDPGGDAARLIEELARLGVTVRAIVATHAHFDHLIAGQELRAHTGAPFHLHSADRFLLDWWYESGRLFLGVELPPPPDVDADADEGLVLVAGSTKLEVLHTPGHTPGSVCVVVAVDGRRILLAGDTLFGGFSPEIGSDADAWRASLERLAGLDVDALSFGHCVTRLLDDPSGRIAEARLRFASYFDPWFKPPRHTFRY